MYVANQETTDNINLRFLPTRFRHGLVLRRLTSKLLKEPRQKHYMRLTATEQLCTKPQGPISLNDIAFFQYESYHCCQLLPSIVAKHLFLPSFPCTIINSTRQDALSSDSSYMIRPSSTLVSRAGRVMIVKEVLSLRMMRIILSFDLLK